MTTTNDTQAAPAVDMLDMEPFNSFREWYKQRPNRLRLFFDNKHLPGIAEGFAAIDKTLDTHRELCVQKLTLERQVKNLSEACDHTLLLLLLRGLDTRTYPEHGAMLTFLDCVPVYIANRPPNPAPPSSQPSEEIVYATPTNRPEPSGSRQNPIVVEPTPPPNRNPPRRRRTDPAPRTQTETHPPLPPHRAMCFCCNRIGHYACNCRTYRCYICRKLAPGHYPRRCPLIPARRESPPAYDYDADEDFDFDDAAIANMTGEPYGN